MSAGPAPAGVAAQWQRHERNLSGQYSGTVSDSTFGSGTATADFAALYGTLGGWLSFTFGSTTYMLAAVSSSEGNGVRGVLANTIGSTACSFAFKATYDASSNTLDGTYRAINGCSGENGSFSLTQQCYYQERGSDLRRDAGIMHC